MCTKGDTVSEGECVVRLAMGVLQWGGWVTYAVRTEGLTCWQVNGGVFEHLFLSYSDASHTHLTMLSSRASIVQCVSQRGLHR